MSALPLLLRGFIMTCSALLASADCGTWLQDHCHCWPGLGDQSQQLLTGLHRRCSLASTPHATTQGTEGTQSDLKDGAAQQLTSQHIEEARKPALQHMAEPKVFVGVLTAAGNAAARQAGETCTCSVKLGHWVPQLQLHVSVLHLSCSCSNCCAAVRSTWGADPRLHKVLFFSAKPQNASLFDELRR